MDLKQKTFLFGFRDILRSKVRETKGLVQEGFKIKLDMMDAVIDGLSLIEEVNNSEVEKVINKIKKQEGM